MNKKNKNFIQLPLSKGAEEVSYHHKSNNIEPFSTEVIQDKKIPHSFIEITGLGIRKWSKSFKKNKIFHAKNPALNPYKKKDADVRFFLQPDEDYIINFWRFRIFLKNNYKEYKRDYDNGVLRVNYFTDHSDHEGFDSNISKFYNCGSNFELEVFDNDVYFTHLKNLILNGEKKLEEGKIYDYERFSDIDYECTIDLDLSPIIYISPVYTDKNNNETVASITSQGKKPVKNPIGITYGIKSFNLDIL